MSTFSTTDAGKHPAPTFALFARGFRPFFLGSGAVSLLALAGWLAMLHGHLVLPGPYDPLAWHAHEMLFGALGAALAGFLLTAIPNWTGRLPLAGRPLALLFALWLLGRLALAFGAGLGAPAVAALDLAFWLVLLAAVAREILAGRNWRNLPVLGGLLAFTLANALFHGAQLGLDLDPALGWRLAIAILVILVSLIGGRIVPSFTGNWLAQRGRPRPPGACKRLEAATLLTTLAASLAWALELPWAWFLLLPAALLQAVRLGRWRGWRTAAEPLVWILHVAYAWLPVALLLAGLAMRWPDLVPPSAALHAFAAGVLASMTIAVMTRAILGHTGRPLAAGRGTTAIYLLVTAAGLLRLAAAFVPAWQLPLLGLAGLAWVGAYGGFLLLYGRLCLRSRPDGRPG